MKQYLDLLTQALSGEDSDTERTGAGTIGVYQRQARFNLEEGFPILTTKRVYWKGVVEEALWFLRGETNIRSLAQKNVDIWTSDALRYNLPKVIESGLMTQDEINTAKTEAKAGNYERANALIGKFKQKIVEDENFANLAGNLGPVYGAQWRGTNGAKSIDQISDLEKELKKGGSSRRMIVTAWDSSQVKDMALPACHLMWQVHISPETKKLHLGWYQRSCDTILGVPFNIASYGLIANLLAHTHGFEKGELIGTFGDLHVYKPHIPAAREQLLREPKPLPTLNIKTKKDSITQYTSDDIELVGYKPHPKLENPTPMFGGFF